MARTPALTAFALLLLTAAAARAQDSARGSDRPCFRARPAPQCSVWLVTNAGGFFSAGNPGTGETRLRGLVDWGVMFNLDTRNAIGGSWFVSMDQDEFTTGPVVRYRRWFEGDRSLDVALGTRARGGGTMLSGSLLGMVKYNPVHWLGIAVRPELVRHQDYLCDMTGCTPVRRTVGRAFVGVEVGWVPGLVLSVASGSALGVFVILCAASHCFDD